MSTRDFDPESLPVPDLGLQCLGCQYRLAGLMQHRCPECGRLFTLDEHIPPGDWPPMIVDREEIRATGEIAALLRAAQIPMMVVRESAAIAYGLTDTMTNSPRLAVPRANYWEANELIRRHRRGEAVDLPAVVDEADWTCPKCGETNPANFEVCWQCNDNRPE